MPGMLSDVRKGTRGISVITASDDPVHITRGYKFKLLERNSEMNVSVARWPNLKSPFNSHITNREICPNNVRKIARKCRNPMKTYPCHPIQICPDRKSRSAYRHYVVHCWARIALRFAPGCPSTWPGTLSSPSHRLPRIKHAWGPSSWSRTRRCCSWWRPGKNFFRFLNHRITSALSFKLTSVHISPTGVYGESGWAYDIIATHIRDRTSDNIKPSLIHQQATEDWEPIVYTIYLAAFQNVGKYYSLSLEM